MIKRDVLYEGALRVAAGTLQRAEVDHVSATTVLGIVGTDDIAQFQELVDRIADEAGLAARVRLRGDSFSVRFSRRATTVENASHTVGLKALVLGLLRG